MLRRNLWTEVGLVNGIMGTIHSIIFKQGESPQSGHLPMAVNVQFGEEYSGPSFEGLPKNCIPISPVTAEWQSFSKTTQQYSSHSRKQIPLSLAWAVTVHKSQGQTLPQVVISLQTTRPGLLFVALSRVKKIEHIKISPVDRYSFLHKLEQGVSERLHEERRVHKIWEETKAWSFCYLKNALERTPQYPNFVASSVRNPKKKH